MATKGVVTERRMSRLVTLPAPVPGFVGDGHTAVHVIDGRTFAESDPFIVFADDRLDLPGGRRAGAAHPHAGFEIVTFVVDGEARDRDEGVLRSGDVLWMTAGSGVVHNEDVEPAGRLRILQLWVTLPSESRWVSPRFERLAREDVPVRREPGIEARVYAGTSGSIEVTPRLYLPLTMVDVRLAPHALFEQELPGSYNGFLYPLDGAVRVGGAKSPIVSTGQIAWLAPDGGSPPLRLTGGESGARVVLYAGEPQRVPIVTHGPFVGESRADLVRLAQLYTEGRMPRVSQLGRR